MAVFSDIARSIKARSLTDPSYRFLLDEDESGEVVSLHCRASSFDLARAELRSVCAIRIRDNRILTSSALNLDFEKGAPAEPAFQELMAFLGSRPLVGYYLDFSVGLLDKHIQPIIGIGLPHQRIEVSTLYFELKIPFFSGRRVDLRLASMLTDLDLPPRGGADAYAHALCAALIYLKLQTPVEKPAPDAAPEPAKVKS